MYINGRLLKYKLFSILMKRFFKQKRLTSSLMTMSEYIVDKRIKNKDASRYPIYIFKPFMKLIIIYASGESIETILTRFLKNFNETALDEYHELLKTKGETITHLTETIEDLGKLFFDEIAWKDCGINNLFYWHSMRNRWWFHVQNLYQESIKKIEEYG